MLSRFLLFFCFFALPFSYAYADACKQYKVSSALITEWSGSPEDACSVYASYLSGQSDYDYRINSPTESQCRMQARDRTIPDSLYGGNYTMGITSRSIECLPEPDKCLGNKDKVSVVNFTAGWTRDGTLDTPVGVFSAPGVSYQSACVAGCTVAIGDQANSTAWVSTVPAPSGLYRASVDSEVVGSGASCTEETPEADPAAPFMPCPGFVGQVNGKTTCVGTASSPLPAGSGDTKPIRDSQNPNDAKGNPTAGDKPSTGEGSGTGGSGRTPSAGNGTAAGGPAGAAGGTGTTPDGTKDKPGEGKEQAACGAPGQPACKIDESGTPKKFSGDSKGLDDWKTTMEANRDQIKGAGDGIFGGMNIFFSAPPVASCAPYELPKDMGSIDPCGVADGVRAVMAYIWALGGLFLCIGWIREAV